MRSQDRGGCTVEDFCNHIHRSLLKDVKYVLAWGTSAKHYPQRCGLSHVLSDEDVVQIVKKKVCEPWLYLSYPLISFLNSERERVIPMMEVKVIAPPPPLSDPASENH